MLSFLSGQISDAFIYKPGEQFRSLGAPAGHLKKTRKDVIFSSYK